MFNPYALIGTKKAGAKRGIGFLTADKMALESGVAYGGYARVRAGVLYCLKQSAEVDGDTYLPLPDLCKSVCKMLKIKMVELTPVFNDVIRDLVTARVLVSVDDGDIAGLALTKFFTAETIKSL